MAKKKTNSKKKKDKEEKDIELFDDESNFFSSLSSETVRGVIGVALFVLAILLILSALGLAGIAGEKVFAGIFYIVGYGYWLVPLLMFGFAWSLFTNGDYDQNRLRSIRTVGAFGFFFSVLGLLKIVFTDETAGKLGVLITTPLIHYVDVIATIVILVGVLIISLLLLFDAGLWILLGNKLFGLFKKDTDLLEYGEEDYVEGEETLEGDSKDEYVEEEEEDVYYKDDDLRIPEGGTGDTKAKKEKVFQLPSEYSPPPISLLEGDRGKANTGGDTKIRSNIIKRTLQHFKISVEMDEVVVGPTVTRFSLKPAAGIKLSKIVALQSNLELALAASPIRIEAPIPGKSLVGIEVPNSQKAIVGLNSVLSYEKFQNAQTPLYMALGKDIVGNMHYADIGKMPHLLVAGATGTGKSVMIHTIITSLLYRNGPERLKFIMVDPKRVELTLYNNIPHLLTPVITEAKKCILSLKWAAKEMDRRYDILQENGVQNIAGYHNDVVAPVYKKLEKAKKKGKELEGVEVPEQMPHIVIVIDELAEIMSSYPRELEAAIVRLAQLSRAVGIHLVLSTQRPDVKVITGLIKANVPTRIALKVNSLIESRIILDQAGAEKLLGAGDMLYQSSETPVPIRIQVPFLTTSEVKKVVAHLSENNAYELDASIDFSNNDGNGESAGLAFDRIEEEDNLDELYEDVRDFVVTEKKASTSLIQRRFSVGYGRAARIMDQLERRGVIGPSDGNKPRTILEMSGEIDDAYEDDYDEEHEVNEYEDE